MKKILSFLFIIALSGCSQFDHSNSDEASQLMTVAWDQHKQKLEQIKNWSLSGKIAIYIEKERQSANLHWRQTGEDYSIQLTTFIGTRILQVTKNSEGVEIINDEGEKFVGQDASTLIRELSPGLDLPIASLQQWIKGNPVDASYQLNDQQLVSDLLGKDENSGLWAVNYQQYQLYGNNLLPRKIELKQDHIRVKIAINQWKTPTI